MDDHIVLDICVVANGDAVHVTCSAVKPFTEPCAATPCTEPSTELSHALGLAVQLSPLRVPAHSPCFASTPPYASLCAPLNTAPYQMELLAPILTSPSTFADGYKQKGYACMHCGHSCMARLSTCPVYEAK